MGYNKMGVSDTHVFSQRHISNRAQVMNKELQDLYNHNRPKVLGLVVILLSAIAITLFCNPGVARAAFSIGQNRSFLRNLRKTTNDDHQEQKLLLLGAELSADAYHEKWFGLQIPGENYKFTHYKNHKLSKGIFGAAEC